MAEEKEINKRVKVKIDYNQPFGAVLAQHMKLYRWSGAELAREVGCTRNHISELISGKCHPSFILGLKITSVFGCSLVWRKTPAIPKSSRKKKEVAFAEAQEVSLESSKPILEAEGSNPKKDKLKKLKDLQEKTSTAKKADEE